MIAPIRRLIVYVKFGIGDIVNPVDFKIKEYRWMHQLNTFQPMNIPSDGVTPDRGVNWGVIVNRIFLPFHMAIYSIDK